MAYTDLSRTNFISECKNYLVVQNVFLGVKILHKAEYVAVSRTNVNGGQWNQTMQTVISPARGGQMDEMYPPHPQVCDRELIIVQCSSSTQLLFIRSSREYTTMYTIKSKALCDTDL